MQTKIRQSDKSDFERVETFIQYKEKGELSSPDQTAAKIIEIMKRTDFRLLDPILDLRNF